MRLKSGYLIYASIIDSSNIIQIGYERGIHLGIMSPSYNLRSVRPAPTPEYAISHLSMLFGFPEIIAEALHFTRGSYPEVVQTFLAKAYLPYCRAYNGGPDVQAGEFGFEFPKSAGWRQSHSTLTAFAAV